MDTISHGIWAFILFFRYPKLRWWAFLLGMLPDILTVPAHIFLDHKTGGQFWYDQVYMYTHSLVILIFVAAIIYYITRSIPLLAGAWASHTILDMFTHPASYYPTPYLFPFYSPPVPAISYISMTFMVVNYSLIVVALGVLIFKDRKTRKS